MTNVLVFIRLLDFVGAKPKLGQLEGLDMEIDLPTSNHQVPRHISISNINSYFTWV